MRAQPRFTCFTGTKVLALTPAEARCGMQFSCFTSTQVQILTQKWHSTQFTCFVSTKVQILTQQQHRRADACCDAAVLSLLALLVQKYKY